MSDDYNAIISAEDANAVINDKLKKTFDGRIVRKDLTKKIKEGANVPVYVLEFLLGQYCSSDDEFVIEEGLNTVKRILADNYVRPDEAQKIISQLRQRGSYTVIDKLTVTLNIKNDVYEAEFMNLGLKISRFLKATRPSLTVCFAVVFGVLSVLITNTSRKKGICLPLKSVSSLQSKCHILILMS